MTTTAMVDRDTVTSILRRKVIVVACTLLLCVVEFSYGSYSLVLSNGTNLFPYPSPKFNLNAEVDPVGNVNSNLGSVKEEVTPSSIDGLLLEDIAPSLAQCLRDVSNKELAIPALQEIYDNLQFRPSQSTEEKRVDTIASSIDKKLQDYLNVLSKTRTAVENAIHERVMGPTQLPSAAHPCFINSVRDEYYDVRYARPLRRLGHPGPRHGFNLTSGDYKMSNHTFNFIFLFENDQYCLSTLYYSVCAKYEVSTINETSISYGRNWVFSQ